MLAGLIAPSAGSARINGLELGARLAARSARMTGVLTESPGLHDKLTARQNLGYYGRLYGLRGAHAAPSRRPIPRTSSACRPRRIAASAGFSKGMRQKVAIARALLHEPEVLYLDEPTSALDPSAAKTVRDFVATLRDAGRSIVVCTHNLDEAERLCDRIGIMRGTLLLVDTPARPAAPAAERRRSGSTSSARAGRVRSSTCLPRSPSCEGARSARTARLYVEVGDPRGDNPELVRALVDAGARIVGVAEEAATLEQVYLDLVGEAGDATHGPVVEAA